jgi:hypothetical protein
MGGSGSAPDPSTTCRLVFQKFTRTPDLIKRPCRIASGCRQLGPNRVFSDVTGLALKRL